MNNENLIQSEIVRIRHHVMKMIYHSGSRSVKIPSIRTMAQELGVANSTVQLAFERMIADGYLISKRGIGTFTNPRAAFSPLSGRPLPLIGLKLSSGDMFFYASFGQRDIAVLMQEFLQHDCNVRFLTYGCNTAEEFRQEVESSGVDALICLQVKPEFVKAAAKVVPTVNIGVPLKGVESLSMGFDKFVARIMDILREKNLPQTAFSLGDWGSLAPFMPQLKAGFGKNLTVTSSPASHEELDEMLTEAFTRKHLPGAIFCASSMIPAIREFAEKQQISEQSLIIVSIDNSVLRLGIEAYYPKSTHETILPEAVKTVFAMLDDPKREITHQVFENVLLFNSLKQKG